MATSTVEVRVIFNDFAKIADEMQPRADQVSRKVAFDIVADYQQNARRDSGAQVNSAYVVTTGDSTYAQAAADARQANARVELLNEVQPVAGQAIAAIAVNYAAINEFGGHGHVGDGALTKAAERQREGYYDALNQLIVQSGR